MLKRSFNPDLLRRKIVLLLLVVLFITTIVFADTAITRGPEIGEIYFIGPTATGEGIYLYKMCLHPDSSGKAGKIYFYEKNAFSKINKKIGVKK